MTDIGGKDICMYMGRIWRGDDRFRGYHLEGCSHFFFTRLTSVSW